MTKRNIILLVVFFFVLVGVAIFWYLSLTPKAQAPTEVEQNSTSTMESPTTVSTEDWKTCRNEKAGYELKYPAGWHTYGEGSMAKDEPQIIQETPCSGSYVVFSSIKIPDASEAELNGAESFGIRAHTPETPDEAKIYKESKSIQEYISNLSPYYLKKVIIKKNYIDGEDAAFTPWNGDIIIYHDDSFYDFNFGIDPNINNITQTAILNSFRFLK